MSAFAKTFVIINLVLAFVFLFVVGGWIAHTKEWRDYYNYFKASYLQKTQEAKDEITAWESKIPPREEQIKSLEQNIKTEDAYIFFLAFPIQDYYKHIAQETEEYERLLKQHNMIQRQINEIKEINQKLRNRKEQIMRERDIARNRRDIAENQAARLTDIIEGLKKEIADLDEVYKIDKKELADKLLITRILQSKGINVWELAHPTFPPIEATVESVRMDLDLVVINKGKKDNIKRGYIFFIFRGSKFIATVEITSVFADSSGGRIIYAREGEKVKIGDTAVTRLD